MSSWWGFLRSLVIYYNPISLRRWKDFYQQLLGPGDLAFDIGAHVGSRARAMHRAGASVVALEPQQPFVAFLRWSLPEGVTLVEAAAGATETSAELAVSRRHPTVSSLRTDFVAEAHDAPGFGHVRWDRSQRVHVTTLDRVIAQYGIPDYIKIDVEGFEWEVLSGLSQAVPMISVEFLPGFPKLSQKVVERLSDLGEYRFNAVVGEQARFYWSEWQDSASTQAWLSSLDPDSTSGDLFARIEPSVPAG